jgi:hypothetical protein
MTYKHFIERLRIKFGESLGEKTNWGRNQVMEKFDTSISSVLIEVLDEEVSNG